MENKIKQNTSNCISLEEAAQKFTDTFYEEFGDSIILTRLFATVPFSELPAPNQSFVLALADSQGITSLVNDRLQVLSLLGTRGVASAWNARQDSKGHIGIPLASADFIDRIPMMSRLLKELGLENGDLVEVLPARRPESLTFIREKILGERLTPWK